MKPYVSARTAICAALACVLLYFFPLVRVRQLASGDAATHVQSSANGGATQGNATQLSGAEGSFSDIDAFIEDLWNERLPKAAKTAAKVDDVLAMAASDASGARKKFGREVGLGGPTFFFLKGSGTIESVDDDYCRLVIAGQSQRVALEIGIIVSNAVRDATELVAVNDFSNSQDFNQLSSELNARCEKLVIAPVLNQLVVGEQVEFVGCGEVQQGGDFDPLELIPVQLKVIVNAESAE